MIAPGNLIISQRLDMTMPAKIPKPVISSIPRSENDPVTASRMRRNKPGCTANIISESVTRGRIIHRDRPIHILSMKSDIRSMIRTK
jgi:hypothetical protein